MYLKYKFTFINRWSGLCNCVALCNC